MRTILIITLCACSLGTFGGCGSANKPQAAPAAAKTAPAAVPTQPVGEFAADSVSVAEPTSHSLAAGTVVPVRLESVIDSSVSNRGFAVGSVETDVKGAGGGIALPAGSHVSIVVRDATKAGPISTVRLGLYSVNVAGHQSSLTNGVKDAATLVLTEDAGKGPSHSAVHLQYGSHVDFTLESPVQLR